MLSWSKHILEKHFAKPSVLYVVLTTYLVLGFNFENTFLHNLLYFKGLS